MLLDERLRSGNRLALSRGVIPGLKQVSCLNSVLSPKIRVTGTLRSAMIPSGTLVTVAAGSDIPAASVTSDKARRRGRRRQVLAEP